MEVFEMDTGNNHDAMLVNRINTMLKIMGTNDTALEFILKQYMDNDDLENLLNTFNGSDCFAFEGKV